MRKMTYLTGLAAALAMLVTVGHGEAKAAETYKWNVPLIWTPPHHVRAEQEVFRAPLRIGELPEDNV